MEIGGLGLTEIIVLLFFLLIIIGGPLLLIVAFVLFSNRRKKANTGVKKCAFCGYSIQAGATTCQSCGKDVAQ